MKYVPCTPGGSLLVNLASKTKKKAIAKLMKDADHMPYETWEDFEKRGYSIERIRI